MKKLIFTSLAVAAFLIAYLLPLDMAKPYEPGVSVPQNINAPKPLQMASHQKFETLAVVPVTPLQFVQAEANQYGWGSGYQWQSLQKLLNNESSFNPYAINPTSGACGVFQAWPCSKLGVPLSDVAGQAKWGCIYIKDRYGSPAQALAFWEAQDPHAY